MTTVCYRRSEHIVSYQPFIWLNAHVGSCRVLKQLMHEMIPGSQVIWYDAVTTAGILEWQDTLNDHNMPFFEAADAIFINYTWKEDTPQLAAAVAGARRSQVYMGVDVFGRNTFGGGGMTCDVALKAARSAGGSRMR